ncbi:MAG: hypothetical protein M1608_04250 [Candidatus Omnitrophica bacterium]|nr:hypothetical protein [Candidatus Omnitrophota bacterium]
MQSTTRHSQMKALMTALALWLAISAPASLAASAEESNAPASGHDFQSFKIIFERNIFNPNRRPVSNRGSQDEGAPSPRIDGFSLIGTLIYDKGSYAFFDGTESKYKTVLRPLDSIAGFKVTEITPNSVRLLSASNSFELPMNMQIKREDEGEWRLVSGTGSWAPSTVSTNADNNASETGSSNTGSSSGGADDVLKRLMQKRQQELAK